MRTLLDLTALQAPGWQIAMYGLVALLVVLVPLAVWALLGAGVRRDR